MRVVRGLRRAAVNAEAVPVIYRTGRRSLTAPHRYALMQRSLYHYPPLGEHWIVHSSRLLCTSVTPAQNERKEPPAAVNTKKPVGGMPQEVVVPAQELGDEDQAENKETTDVLSKAEIRMKLQVPPKKGKKKKQSQGVLTSMRTTVVKGVKAIPEYTIWFLKGTVQVTVMAIRNPYKLVEWSKEGWRMTKDFVHHTATGFRLLGVEVRTSLSLVRKKLRGHTLTRRERKQLVRTMTDLARIVPFSFFIIVPAMEVFLPLALRLFPNMLPSTFQDSYKREEDMKNQLKLRLELASFLQEMVVEMGQKVHRKDVSAEENVDNFTFEELQQFIYRTRVGETLPDDIMFKVAKLFSDELTIENMSRSQLVLLCRYMGLPSYGGDDFLRYQLRQNINGLREDDRQIYWEGVDALNLLELKQACQDRGMRATGLTKDELKLQLNRWLELSVNRNVSVSLLILSRAFTLEMPVTATESDAISEAIGKLDSDITRVALAEGLESLDGVKVDSKTLTEMKLEAIQLQNELIAAESKEKKAKEYVKEQKEKSKHKEGATAETIEGTEMSVDKDLAPELKTGPVMEDTASVLADIVEEKDMSPSEVAEALESLKILAADSSVESEMKQLEEIVSKQVELTGQDHHADSTTAVESDYAGVEAGADTGAEVEEEEEEEEEDLTKARLQQRVARMLDSLQEEVTNVDMSIGDKLKLLDTDGDGVVSCTELQHAIKVGLKEQYTPSEIQKLLDMLDLDRDGKVTIEELDEILTANLTKKQQEE